MDIDPVDLPELTFEHAIQAGQRISQQPTAVAGQDVEERPSEPATTEIAAAEPAGRTASSCLARRTSGPSGVHAVSTSDHKFASSCGAGTLNSSGSTVTGGYEQHGGSEPQEAISTHIGQHVAETVLRWSHLGSRTRIPASCRMAAVSAPCRSGQRPDYARSPRYMRQIRTLALSGLCAGHRAPAPAWPPALLPSPAQASRRGAGCAASRRGQPWSGHGAHGAGPRSTRSRQCSGRPAEDAADLPAARARAAPARRTPASRPTGRCR
jgi:hypothetical protein